MDVCKCCQYCGVQFELAEDLKEHEKGHKIFECEECDLLFESKEQYEKHIKTLVQCPCGYIGPHLSKKCI